MTVVNGLAGKVTSWSGYTALIGTLAKPLGITLDMQGGNSDKTGFGSSGVIVKANNPTLRSYLARIQGYFLNAGPVNGSTGLITFASGFVAHAHAFTLEITWDEEQYAVFNGSGVDDWSYAPLLASWRGTWTTYLDSDTAFSDIDGATDSSAAATFKLFENTVDDTLAGNIIVTGGPVQVPVNGLPTLQYSFMGDGQLTAAGTVLGVTGTGIFDDSAKTLVTPTPGSLVWQIAASRTVTATAFPNRVAIGCQIGQTTTLDIDARISGGITIG